VPPITSAVKALKTWIFALFVLKEGNQKFSLCGWGPQLDDVIKKPKPTPIMTLSTKKLKSKHSQFCNRKYNFYRFFRGFEVTAL